MIPQGGGKIVNIGSNFGVVAFKRRSVYAAAKAGVHHLSRALSLEWASQGVTRQRRRALHHRDRVAQEHSRAAGLQRVGDDADAAGRAGGTSPTDLVGAVLFLSSHLSDMVVGHVLMVDGGWTIH